VQALSRFDSFLFTRITHWLVIRNGVRYLLAGTIALAAAGAVVSSSQGSGLPNLSSIPSVVHIGDNDNDHDGWYGGHRYHHDGNYYFGRHHGLGGTWGSGSDNGGNGFVYKGGFQPGSGNGGNGYVYQGGYGYAPQGSGN
jgi:hypothetical protein